MKKKAYIPPVTKPRQMAARVMVITGSNGQDSIGFSMSLEQEVEENPNGSRLWNCWEEDY